MNFFETAVLKMIPEFQKSKICPDDFNYFRLFLFQAVHCNSWNVQSLRSSEDPDFFLCGFFRSQFKNYQQVEYQKVWRKMILSEPLVNILRRDTKPCREEASADFWMSAPGWLSTQFNEACEGEMRQHKAGKFQTWSVFVFFFPQEWVCLLCCCFKRWVSIRGGSEVTLASFTSCLRDSWLLLCTV